MQSPENDYTSAVKVSIRRSCSLVVVSAQHLALFVHIVFGLYAFFSAQAGCYPGVIECYVILKSTEFSDPPPNNVHYSCC